jgi:hypothetical protein
MPNSMSNMKKRIWELAKKEVLSALEYNELKKILEDPAIKLNIKDQQGNSPLYYACLVGNTAFVKGCLGSNKSIQLYRAEGADKNETAFIAACGKGHSEIVKLFLNLPGFDINKCAQNFGIFDGPSASPITPLYYAVTKKMPDIVRLLLKGGADLTISNRMDGVTPLHFAIKSFSLSPQTETVYGEIILHIVSFWLYTTNSFSIPAMPEDATTFPQRKEEYHKEITEMQKERISITAATCFAMMTFLIDGYMQVQQQSQPTLFSIFKRSQKEAEQNAVRFFSIAQNLPVELQMILCNYLVDKTSLFVREQHFSQAEEVEMDRIKKLKEKKR